MPRMEVHDEHGRRIDPPEGVVYESLAASMPAEPVGVFEPTESDECVFRKLRLAVDHHLPANRPGDDTCLGATPAPTGYFQSLISFSTASSLDVTVSHWSHDVGTSRDTGTP